MSRSNKRLSGRFTLIEALDIRLLFANVNDSWQRSTDWASAPITNPDAGITSGGAWQYESLPIADGQGQANPWYVNTLNPWPNNVTTATTPDKKLTWDDNWATSGVGGWTNGDNTAPLIQQNTIVQTLSAATTRVPVVRWWNQTGQDVTVSLSGTLIFSWSGGAAIDKPLDFIMGVVRPRDTANPFEIISQVTRVQPKGAPAPATRDASYPNVQDASANKIDLSDLSAIKVPEGGSIAYTFRYSGAPMSSSWITLNDSQLKVTLQSFGAVPLTKPDSGVTDKNFSTNIEVLENDEWAPNTLPRVFIVPGQTQGTVSVLADQSISYTPPNNYTGADTITYKVFDGVAYSANSTVSLTVNDPYFIYVSTTGNDGNAGTSWGTSLRTLTGARDKIRALRSQTPSPLLNRSVSVMLDDGIYSSNTVINFDDARDSGTAQYPVTYRAAHSVAAPAPLPNYSPGFTWNRSADWTAATNPDSDSRGNATWTYLYPLGDTGDIKFSDPWYKSPTSPLVWDTSWADTGSNPGWVVSNNHAAFINQTGMLHVLSTADVAKTPETVWTNPTGQAMTLTISGPLTVDFSGGPAAGTSADVILAKKSGNAWTTIYTQTALLSAGNKQPLLNFKPTDVDVAPGDQIRLSIRGKSNGTSGWVTLTDNLTYTIKSVNANRGLPTATLSGGKTLNLTWNQLTGAEATRNPGAWYADLSTQLTPAQQAAINTLIVDGTRATRAREPDVGYYTIVSTVMDTAQAQNRQNSFTFDNTTVKGYGQSRVTNPQYNILSSWTNLSNVEIVNYSAYSESRMKISSVDDVNHKVVVQGLNYHGSSNYGGDYGINFSTGIGDGTSRYYVENVLEGLKTEGEWYLNPAEQRLYYKPLWGYTPASSTFVVPLTKQLIQMTGTNNIQFEGITFANSDWSMLNTGQFGPPSATANATPGAVRLDNTSNISFANDRFVNNGNYGIHILQNATNTSIVNSQFYDNGGGAVQINNGGVYSTTLNGTPITGFNSSDGDNGGVILSGNNRIALNTIHDNNAVWRGGPAVFVGLSGNNRIINNTIYNVAYDGIGVISVSAKKNVADVGHNLIVGNEVAGAMQTLYDGGGIYINGTQTGTVVMNNRISSILYTSNHLWRAPSTNIYGGGVIGLYMDGYCRGIAALGNTITDTNWGFVIDNAVDNFISSNVIVDAQFGAELIDLRTNGGSLAPYNGANRIMSGVVSWTRPIAPGLPTAPSSPYLRYTLNSNPFVTYDGNVYSAPAGTVTPVVFVDTTRTPIYSEDHQHVVFTINALFVYTLFKDFRIDSTAQSLVTTNKFLADWLFA
jgi:hypothetical protein